MSTAHTTIIIDRLLSHPFLNVTLETGIATTTMTTTASNDHVARTVGSYLLVYSLVFGMSATVNVKSLKKQIVNKVAWLSGIFVQFVVLPFLGFAIIKVLDLKESSGLTLLVLLSSPGGVYSNWCCSIFNGDLALSVSMTIISNFVSIVMMPCNIILYSTHLYGDDVIESIGWFNLFIGLIVVFMASTFGSFCSASINTTQFNLFANRMGNISGFSLVLFTFLVIQFAAETKIHLYSQSWQFYLALATPCVVALSLSTFFVTYFMLPGPERLAVVIESSFQNGGVATSFALAMFHPTLLPDVLAIPLYYTVVQAIILVIYCFIAWKIGWTKAPINDSLCLVMGKPYEIWDNVGEGNSQQEDGDNNVQTETTAERVEQSIDDGIVSVNLQKIHVETPYQQQESAIDVNVGTAETYVDDRSVTRPKLNLFRKKLKVMDSETPPTLSPTSTLSPEAFEHTTKNGKSFRAKNKKRRGRSSIAVQRTLIVDDTIKEDSLAEDPDISIAGESDLESGLSLSRHNTDDVSLSGFSMKDQTTNGDHQTQNSTEDPTSTGSSTLDINTSSTGRPPLDKNTTPPRSNTSQPLTVDPSISEDVQNATNSPLRKGESDIPSDSADHVRADTTPTMPVTDTTKNLPPLKTEEGFTEQPNETNTGSDVTETPATEENSDNSKELDSNQNNEEITVNENIDQGISTVAVKEDSELGIKVETTEGSSNQDVSTETVKDDSELNMVPEGKMVSQVDDFSIGSRSKFSI